MNQKQRKLKLKLENLSSEIVKENEEVNLRMLLKHENGTCSSSAFDNDEGLSLGFAKLELDLNVVVLPPPMLNKEEEIYVH